MSLWLARGLRIIGVVGVIGAVLATRVVLESRTELRRGQTLRAAGDLEGAVIHFRRAARWYAPGNPYCREALDSLAEVAREAEAAAEPARALAAWRSIHAAIAATRGVTLPHAQRLREADRHIARLMAQGSDLSVRELERDLSELPRPSPLWTALLLLGFVTWIAAAFALASHGFDAEDRWKSRVAWPLVATIIGGFAAFVIGLSFA